MSVNSLIGKDDESENVKAIPQKDQHQVVVP